MTESTRIRVTVCFFFVAILFCNHIFTASAQAEQEKPSLLKIIFRIFGKKFPPTSWELIQAAIQKIKMKIYHPNLDFRSKSEGKGEEGKGGENSAGEMVKEAAKKSLETSKETIEGSAKLAGDAVGGAVQRTAEKVKNKASHDEI
ncbi:PREDICTED: uncharacterized protein LOC104799297 [Tarenaya hassleriana]|uniref:uncharacterized protein LOC104799297 n=1 Tax=Tarenaya hassleriana TaxID=28532 RepID=UPI00053C8471|nr:PREDICTED: uncharacterized protein LOC104799297 [Tarenaya hassleriana]